MAILFLTGVMYYCITMYLMTRYDISVAISRTMVKKIVMCLDVLPEVCYRKLHLSKERLSLHQSKELLSLSPLT